MSLQLQQFVSMDYHELEAKKQELNHEVQWKYPTRRRRDIQKDLTSINLLLFLSDDQKIIVEEMLKKLKDTENNLWEISYNVLEMRINQAREAWVDEKVIKEVEDKLPVRNE